MDFKWNNFHHYEIGYLKERLNAGEDIYPKDVPKMMKRVYSKSDPREIITKDRVSINYKGRSRNLDLKNSLNRIISAYDRGIKAADNELSYMFNCLDEMGILNDTVVVLISDHGESFMKNGKFYHSWGCKEEQAKVALMMRFPSMEREGRVSKDVTLLDVAPTLLDYLEINIPKAMEGGKLLPTWTIDSDRNIWSSSQDREIMCLYGNNYMLRRNGTQYSIYDRTREPYQLNVLEGHDFVKNSLKYKFEDMKDEWEKTKEHHGKII